MQLLQKSLRPEFLNRVDEVLVFHPLSKGSLHRIVEVQFERLVRDNLLRNGMDARITAAAKDWLADQGYDPVFGARPLKRLMLKAIVNEISSRIVITSYSIHYTKLYEARRHTVEKAVHFALQIHHLVDGVPAYDCHGIIPPKWVGSVKRFFARSPVVYSTAVPNV